MHTRHSVILSLVVAALCVGCDHPARPSPPVPPTVTPPVVTPTHSRLDHSTGKVFEAPARTGCAYELKFTQSSRNTVFRYQAFVTLTP